MNQRRVKHLREYFSDIVDIEIFEVCDTDTLLGGYELDEDGDAISDLGEFLVLTWEEALTIVKEDLRNSFWDCNPDVADALINRQDIANVIDVERWAEDLILCAQTNTDQGLGGFLSSYDGEEHEVILDGKAMFIYRVG